MTNWIKRKSIYLRERESRFLVKEAQRLGVSQSEVVRQLIADALDSAAQDDPMERFLGSVSYAPRGARYVDDIYRAQPHERRRPKRG
ncbi:MAG TPA: hypothetical protein VFZ12_09110 [Dehalococcoidia bacterium]|nr:hypothetical protein [Dehalococcoidia bacterium]